tara:strand:- start:793 stop:1365 length:573 start_codon:yes stop_codon:yes gene_type:complete
MKVKATYRLEKELVDRIASTSAIEGRTHTWYISTALNQYFDKPAGIVSKKRPAAKPKENFSPPFHENCPSVLLPSLDDTADKVIDYLNSQAGTRYKHTDTNRKLINARLKEYTKREVFDVITKKCAEWKGSEMERYLRPSTLFNATKFDEYLNQKVIDKPATGRNTPSLDSTRTRDKTVQQQLADKSWAG